jgi:prepilin-type N-terminal cleavage/methylation domain-containing protein
MIRRPPRGFTLIELMLALVVSSLLVGMILAIFSRMSLAYRGQQQIAGVQQVLAAARATIELDAKQAGLEMAQGFKMFNTPPGVVQSPVRVINNSRGDGPDEIRFYYADTSSFTQAAVTGGVLPDINVDQPSNFAAGDVVVLVKVDTVTGLTLNAVDPLIATYDACVLQIAAADTVNPGKVTVATSGLWSDKTPTHCAAAPAAGMMLYKFVARAYRIDTSTPARAALGVLQQSPTGGLLAADADNRWTDLAYGFTDIQVALQIFDPAGTDVDLDGDATRNWWSSTALNGKTDLVPPLALAGPIQMSISLVARTDRNVEGISTPQTPELTEAGVLPIPWVNCCTRDNNPLGDRASIALPAVPPFLADPALSGAFIYRYTTFKIDFRNMGVGR